AVLNRILSPRGHDPDRDTTYECGEPAIGSAWVRFDMRFYTVALVFIIFEVEVAFLFPWAVVYNELVSWGEGPARLFPFLEAFLFVAVLGVGLVYVWMKGDLDWVKSTGARSEPAISGQPPAGPVSKASEPEPEPEPAGSSS
ncbi:MAG: NADH-quinone oxidoreductase subunit A, partial [Planctomycetes bacterium]|nr:NADH-quinone oxidoreductase subunit A [Planctomycetota bacterium]